MTQMHLGVFTYPGGHHIAGWRHPSVAPREILGYEYYRRTAVAAERGKFDLVFVGDMLAAREKDGRVLAQGALNNIDSISILSAIAGATEKVGLVATLSTTYNEPFAIAELIVHRDTRSTPDTHPSADLSILPCLPACSSLTQTPTSYP